MRSGLIAISHVEFLSGLNRVVLIISHKGFMLLFLTTPTFSFLNASTCALGVAWVEKIRKEKKKYGGHYKKNNNNSLMPLGSKCGLI